MISYYFTPARMRGNGCCLEVVREPSEEWFAKVGNCIRFALMQDGVVYWGDADVILHEDICGLKDPDGELGPIMVGSVP